VAGIHGQEEPAIGGSVVARKEAELQISGANRSFGLLLAAVSAVIALIGFFRRENGYVAFGVLAIMFASISLWIPRVLAPLRRGWLKIGHLLGRLVNPVVLGLSYAVVIVPAGLLMRMLRRDSLALRRDASATTYWSRRDVTGPNPESLKEQF